MPLRSSILKPRGCQSQSRQASERSTPWPAGTSISPSDLEFDHGTFDSAGFAAQALASPSALAAVIDHTLLKPEATREQVEKLCHEAATHGFACAMINPVWTSTAASILAGTGIPVGVVIGFPLGASLVSTLRQEATTLTRLGARELDMVLPIGQLKSGNHAAVDHAIRSTAAVPPRRIITGHPEGDSRNLPPDRGREAPRSGDCHSGGHRFPENLYRLFVRRSKQRQDVALLRGVAGARCGVKASGGIRTLAVARTMLEAGANRIGASASVAILRELSGE